MNLSVLQCCRDVRFVNNSFFWIGSFQPSQLTDWAMRWRIGSSGINLHDRLIELTVAFWTYLTNSRHFNSRNTTDKSIWNICHLISTALSTHTLYRELFIIYTNIFNLEMKILVLFTVNASYICVVSTARWRNGIKESLNRCFESVLWNELFKRADSRKWVTTVLYSQCARSDFRALR